MAFRTLEISNPAEIHIKNGQLQIMRDVGTVYIPIEDISNIFCIGPNIRISTMALSILSQQKIVLTTLDSKYLPTAVVTPYDGNARQSQIMHAVVRSAIIRSLVSAGFHPTFGIHHNNQLNSFNLADDFIEPWRAMVDLTVYNMEGTNIYLNKNERYELASILNHACIIKKQKMPIINAIDVMCDSLKRKYLDEDGTMLDLPEIIPIERLNMVNE